MHHLVERHLFEQPSSIADYAVIGDCRSAALISRTGSVDWLCWPHFGSPSIFAAVLDELSGGRFSVHATGTAKHHRAYLPDTNVLVTRHVTDQGELKVTDCMPVAPEERKRKSMAPEHELLRLVECTRGQVEVQVYFQPRFDYGRRARDVRRRGPGRVACQRSGSLLLLDSSIPLEIHGTEATGKCTLREGDVHAVSLTYSDGEPAMMPGLGAHAAERTGQTVEWWRRWVGHCSYDGPHRDHLVRSLLTLKLLTYAPSGAIIAAPTASLPECIGGERNWDYRLCWIRDASLIVSALLDLGYEAESSAYVGWLLHTTRTTAPRLRTVYDVFGRPRTTEQVIKSLSGFQGSRPVRVGNAAWNQLQLDCYGELIGAVTNFVRRGGAIDAASRRMLVGFGEEVCRRWREPDEGIWELRIGRRHNTHSKLLCWVALHCLLSLSREGKLDAVPVERFEHECSAIASAIEERGFQPKHGSYVASFGGSYADASLLLLARLGFTTPGDPRAVGTRKFIERELASGPLVARYRHVDGLAGREGAFGACCFWLVMALAEQGEPSRAAEHLDALLACSNDVGLFAEEFAWEDGAPLGNFPQGFSHVGALHAILAVARAQGHAIGKGHAEEAV